jgi:DNA-binding phage protein
VKYTPMALLRHAEKHIEYHQNVLLKANTELIKVVRAKMTKKGITIHELARFNGISPHTITNWFYSGGIPPLKTLEKIWHFLR